ncbi:MAG TPA: hypothetical protein VL689_11625 [Paraburkholderia sp.]|nr:hypothetical protein [Paraburkholderia sp.]
MLGNLPAGEHAPAVPDLAHLPDETRCFVVERLELTDNPFAWAPAFVQPVIGRCIGGAGLKLVQDALTNELIARVNIA